jgi:hypothetical protein
VVGAIVLLSTVARAAVAMSFDVPWIAPDEVIYGLVGESLWETGQLSVRGAEVPFYSLLTPALVGIPLAVADAETGVAVAQLLQALAMSLVAVPVYLWGRRLVGVGWALGAATLAVLPAALWYGGLLMTEALYYPVVTAALLTLALMLEEPTTARQGVFLLFVTAAATVRLQALVLLPVLLVAVGLHAWFGRTTVTVRKLVPILALVGLATAGLLAAYAADRGDLLGAYGALAEETPSSSGVLTQLVRHGGAVVAMTFGLPLLATATLAVLAALRAEADPALRAFLAVATAYVTLLVAQVAAFAVGYLDHVAERYLVTALPVLLLGLCVWIESGGPRPVRVVVPVALVGVALLAAIPASRVQLELVVHDSFTLVALDALADQGELAFRAGLAALGVLAACAFLLLPQRLLPALAAVVALGFVTTSVAAARQIEHFSSVELANDVGEVDPSWVDRAGVSPVLLVDTGDQPSTAASRTTFANRSIRYLVRLDGVPAQALPKRLVTVRRDGALVDAGGAEVSRPYVVLPLTTTIRGERIATTPPTDIAPGSGLWRVEEPLRLTSRAAGFSPIGDFQRASVVVYHCGPGALEIDLLGKDGAPVIARVNGFPNATFELVPGGARQVAIRPIVAEGSPCVFDLESAGLVGSTRVEWVPGTR